MHVRIRLFSPRTVIYGENSTLFTSTQIGYGAFIKSLPPVHREVRVMRLHSSIAVADIWTRAETRSKYPYRWFPLVILGYLWLSLVILGYPWLSLVIPGYPWLSLVINFNV